MKYIKKPITADKLMKQIEKTKETWSKKPHFEKKCKYCKNLFKTPMYAKVYCKPECCKNFFKENRLTQAFYKVRFDVLNRDKFKCTYCGRSPIEHGIVLEIEHINPRLGKKEDWSKVTLNMLTSSCRECNVGKGTTLLSLPILKRINDKIAK